MAFLESFLLWGQEFITEFSYLGLFIISIISSATVIFPLPLSNIFTGIAAGLGLNPILLSLVAGFGLAIGELTSYLVGFGSRHIIKKQREKIPDFVIRLEHLFKKYGFPMLILISWVPIPFLFDFVGIASGISNYEIKRFFIAVLIGKILKALMFAYIGYFAFLGVENWLGISLTLE